MNSLLVRALRAVGLEPIRVFSEASSTLLGLGLSRRGECNAAHELSAQSKSLIALTSAALALPGLAQGAPGDVASFQYGHYKQSAWQLLDGLKSQYSPLQVDNIEANGLITLEDRWRFGFNYAQDTWSGATPVASAPYALGGNNPTTAGASPLIGGNHSMLYSRNLTPYRLDKQSAQYVPDARLVQTVASASPEIRNQGDFRLGYELSLIHI